MVDLVFYVPLHAHKFTETMLKKYMIEGVVLRSSATLESVLGHVQ